MLLETFTYSTHTFSFNVFIITTFYMVDEH